MRARAASQYVHERRRWPPRAGLEQAWVAHDKTKVVFWDLIKLNVVVYDLSTGKAQRFGQLQGNPMWLDDETVAVTGVRTCNCDGLDYTGRSWSLKITSGRTQPIRMTSTLEADVLR
jgi:hypothetical protein